MGQVIHDVPNICNFVQNHTNALTIYNEYTNLSYLKITNTSFASSLVMPKRLREVKTTLWSMAISEFWSFWRKKDQTTFKKVKDIVLR
jgi:hypothetical protein